MNLIFIFFFCYSCISLIPNHIQIPNYIFLSFRFEHDILLQKTSDFSSSIYFIIFITVSCSRFHYSFRLCNEEETKRKKNKNNNNILFSWLFLVLHFYTLFNLLSSLLCHFSAFNFSCSKINR